MKAEYRIRSDSDVPHRSVIPRVVARWSPFPMITKEKVHKCCWAGCRSGYKEPNYISDREILKQEAMESILSERCCRWDMRLSKWFMFSAIWRQQGGIRSLVLKLFICNPCLLIIPNHSSINKQKSLQVHLNDAHTGGHGALCIVGAWD